MTFTHAHVWTRWEEGVEHFHHTLFHLKNITFIIGSCPTSLNIISLYIYIRYFPHYEFHLPKVTTENTSSGLFSAQYLRPTNQVQATFEFKTEKIREDTDLPTSVLEIPRSPGSAGAQFVVSMDSWGQSCCVFIWQASILTLGMILSMFLKSVSLVILAIISNTTFLPLRWFRMGSVLWNKGHWQIHHPPAFLSPLSWTLLYSGSM